MQNLKGNDAHELICKAEKDLENELMGGTVRESGMDWTHGCV